MSTFQDHYVRVLPVPSDNEDQGGWNKLDSFDRAVYHQTFSRHLMPLMAIYGDCLRDDNIEQSVTLPAVEKAVKNLVQGGFLLKVNGEDLDLMMGLYRRFAPRPG